MSLANMESVKIVENVTITSDKLKAATAPSVNLPKEDSSNKSGNLSQKNLVDSKAGNDKKEPKISKSKKKKKNAKKGKNKDSVPASPSQNEAGEESKTHDSEPGKSGKVSMEFDKEVHKNFKTDVLLDQKSVLEIQVEHEINPAIIQRESPTSKSHAKDMDASETKISELANLATRSSNFEDVISMNPENTSISLSNTVSVALESKQQETPPNPDGPPEISNCNPSFANDNKQDEFNVQESIEDAEQLNIFPELERPHLVVSSNDELVKEKADLESQAVTSNLISETEDFNARFGSSMTETESVSLIEDNSTSMPLQSESRSLVPEKTSIESLRDAAVNKNTSEATVQNENSVTSLVQSGLASTSTLIMNLEDKIVNGVEQTLSTINLGRLIPSSIFQESETSSSTQLKETGITALTEQQTTGKTRDDSNESGTAPLKSLYKLTDIAPKLLNVNSEIQMTSSNNVSESNISTSVQKSYVRDLLDSTVATNEYVTIEVPNVSGDVGHMVQPEVLISETSAILDGKTISYKEIDMIEPSVVTEETSTSMSSLTDLKKSNVETEVIETNCKETTDVIDPPVEADESNITEDNIIGLNERVSELIGDISKNEEVFDNQSDFIHSDQNNPCLCTNNKISKEQDKVLTSDALISNSGTEKKSIGSQGHAETTKNKNIQHENLKNSLESTAGKVISLTDTKVAQASNLIGILRHSKSEFLNSEIVSTSSSDSKNDEIRSQNPAQFSKKEEKFSEENFLITTHSEISNSKEMLDSAVDLDQAKSDGEVSVISPTDNVFGSGASQAEITNKNKFKFKPSVGEQALAPELVTISKETLELLYKRLDSMQLEIERLSSALKNQNETIPASLKGKSNSSLKDDYVITESKRHNTNIIEAREIVNEEPQKQPLKKKSITKTPCLWRLMSIFGYKSITKSDAGLITRSVSENLRSPNPREPKGKGKEIVSQPIKPSTARTYKVIGRVGAKHDLS